MCITDPRTRSECGFVDLFIIMYLDLLSDNHRYYTVGLKIVCKANKSSFFFNISRRVQDTEMRFSSRSGPILIERLIKVSAL